MATGMVVSRMASGPNIICLDIAPVLATKNAHPAHAISVSTNHRSTCFDSLIYSWVIPASPMSFPHSEMFPCHFVCEHNVCQVGTLLFLLARNGKDCQVDTMSEG